MKKRIFSFLAVMMMPIVGFGQAAPGSAAERQREVVAEIEREQSENGPLSPGLIEPLTRLAILYEESGDTVPSVATTERALQIVRTNFGIYSLEQAAMYRRLMNIARSRGDAWAAWEYEQELLELARRNPTDPRIVPILKDVADSRVDLLENYIAGEYPPEIELGCYFAGERKKVSNACSAGSLETAARTILGEAHDAYLAAIDVLLQQESYESDELRALEWEIVNSGMFHGRYLGGSAGCRRVEDRLVRLHEYDVLAETSLQQRVDSLLHIADWKLYCTWNTVALKAYDGVLKMLVKEGATQAEIDRIFAPEAPVMLPGFAKSPLVTEEPFPSAPYVDVAFELTRFGTTRSIDVLEGKKNPGADDVVRLLKRKRFRPYALKGEFVDSQRLVVRYFLGQ